MRKTACPVVWEGAGAQSPSPDPIKFCATQKRRLALPRDAVCHCVSRRLLPADVALNLDEAIQRCPATGDGPEDAQATGDACVDAAHERVVHYVERVDASLEREPLVNLEVAAQADVGLVDARVADTIDEERHDASLVGAGLRAGSLVPTRGAGLAERNHRVARACLGRCQHAAGGIEPLPIEVLAILIWRGSPA